MNNTTSDLKKKVCKKCNKEKPVTRDYFVASKNCKDGFENRCKACRDEYRKKYYSRNKTRERRTQKVYYEENKDYIKECSDKWRETNKERVHKKLKEYYDKNRDKLLQDSKRYRKENKDQISNYHKTWRKNNKDYTTRYYNDYYKDNKEKYIIKSQQREARKRTLPNDFTQEQWGDCKKHFDYKCAYCGKGTDVFHQDHFIPLSKGGEYTKNNIIPACQRCNISKHANDFFGWYPKQEYYSKQRERKILKYLNYNKSKEQQLALL